MAAYSRRNFLKRASVGAAVSAAAVVPTWAAGSAQAEAAGSGPRHDGPFMAWVKDAKTGEIAVMVGEHEVLHHDRRLAADLARIAARAPKS